MNSLTLIILDAVLLFTPFKFVTPVNQITVVHNGTEIKLGLIDEAWTAVAGSSRPYDAIMTEITIGRYAVDSQGCRRVVHWGVAGREVVIEPGLVGDEGKLAIALSRAFRAVIEVGECVE